MWLLAFPFLISMYLLVSRMRRLQTPAFSDKDHMLLIVAHPDDESMFFSPTILSLASSKVAVSVLCLSNGGAYGLGTAREKEMVAACKILKIPSTNVTVIDHPRMQDGMKNDWPAEDVAAEVHKVVMRCKPTQVVTFDAWGVSGHKNHRCTHHGVVQYMRDERYRGLRGDALLTFHQLESTNLLRKFSGLLDLPVSSLLLGRNSRLVVSPYPGIASRAMAQHRSQRTWYRHLFMLLSRYTMMNTLCRME